MMYRQEILYLGAALIVFGVCTISCNNNTYRSYGWRPLEIRHTIQIHDPYDTSQTVHQGNRHPNLWSGYQSLSESVASTTEWIMLYVSWNSGRLPRIPIDMLDPNDQGSYDIVIEFYINLESDLDSLLRSPSYLEFIDQLRADSLDVTTYTVYDPGSGISIMRDHW